MRTCFEVSAAHSSSATPSGTAHLKLCYTLYRSSRSALITAVLHQLTSSSATQSSAALHLKFSATSAIVKDPEISANDLNHDLTQYASGPQWKLEFIPPNEAGSATCTPSGTAHITVLLHSLTQLTSIRALLHLNEKILGKAAHSSFFLLHLTVLRSSSALIYTF